MEGESVMDFRDGYVLENLRPGKMPGKFKKFPTDVLPEPALGYVRNGAKALGCDESYIALPLLSALAAAVGNSRRIQLKKSWCEPAILWTAIVGESGSLKSPAIEMALKPLRKMQGEALNQYEVEMKEYSQELAEYEQEVRQRKRHEPMPEKPNEPIARRYYCSDVTVEAVAGLLKHAPRGLLLARDELAGWLRGFNAYKRKGGDDAQWLELHRAGTLMVDRKTGNPKTIYIPNAAVSVCGGIQPGILEVALGREHFENGLAARLLLAMPPREPKKWTDTDIDAELTDEIKAVFEDLLAMKMANDGYGGFEPVDVPLSDYGQQAWIKFYNEHATEQAEIAGGDLAAAWSKLEGYAARLALIIHCVRVVARAPGAGSGDCIDEHSIGAGATIARWFGAETKRIYAVLGEGDEDRDRRKLVEHIRKKGGRITVRELMQANRQYRGSAEVAESALKELVEIGWGKWQEMPGGPAGGRPSRKFVLTEDKGGNETPTEGLE